MNERIKIFTFISGHGETLVDPPHEDHINEWLASNSGQILEITQSESPRPGGGHHVTVCVCYLPTELEQTSRPSPFGQEQEAR